MITNNDYKQKRLLFLIGRIPNWELYLTDKQLEATKLYLTILDVSLVADKLNLSNSGAYARIFGDSSSKGAIGKLEEAYNKLDKLGFFIKKQEKKKQNTKNIISDKTIEKVKELFKIIVDLENYDQYLTDGQKEKLYRFLSLRSFKECAKYFDISESSFKQSLLGRDDNSGILGKLKKAYDEKYINNWNEI